MSKLTGQATARTGAAALGLSEAAQAPPAMDLRDWYALHAPAPPSWWKVRTPRDLALWAWTWADALVETRAQPTAPSSASPPHTPTN
jgi:hypothetical protein